MLFNIWCHHWEDCLWEDFGIANINLTDSIAKAFGVLQLQKDDI